MSAITLSTKGQVVIPKRLREARNWFAGMALEVQELPQGLLLRPARAQPFAATSVDELMGAVGYSGARLSDADIDAALAHMHHSARLLNS